MEAIVLFLIGIILIIFNIRAVFKEKNSFKNQLDSKQGSIEEFDVKIGKLRQEFGETIFELQKEMEDLKKSVDVTRNLSDNNIKSDKKNFNGENEDKNSKFENYNNVKIDEIKKMIDDKVSIDEIAEKTGIGKGELLLIKELYIK
ncbi:hypothetical protein ACSVC9_08905 [Clostridium sp. LBM24168]